MRFKIILAAVVAGVVYAMTAQAGQTMNLSSMVKLAQATPEEPAPPPIEESTIPLPPPPLAVTASSAAATATAPSAATPAKPSSSPAATPATTTPASAKASYAEGQSCYDKLKNDSAAKKDRARWLQCVNAFAAVSTSGSGDAAKATYSTARLSREMYGVTHAKEDQARALEYYNTVVNDYADTSLADDALLAIAQVRAAQGDKARATKALNALVERYPKSDSVPAAKQMRAELEGKQEETASVASAKELAYEPAPALPASSAAVRASATTAAALPSDEAQIVAVHAAQKKDDTVVTVELSRRAEYRTVYDSAKRELDIHFKDVFTRAGLPQNIAVNSATLASVRVKPRILGGTRVRLTLAPGAEYGVAQRISALTITTRRARPEVTAVVTPGPSVASLPATKTPISPATPSLTTATVAPTSATSSASATSAADQAKRAPLRVVIDPGHGGEEKGAVGPHGIMEKDVVLAIAKRLKDTLEREQGAKVWLTRSGDDTVSLEKRYKIAKKKKSDVFISVHANASTDKKASGIESYYLNNATDEAASRLAARENESWKGPRGEIDKILATMLQNALTDDSRELATSVQRALVKNMGARYKDVKNRKARSALFYVLVATPSPSVLVETSFITNPKEEQRLADPTYQQELARSIAQGVRAYQVAARSINASL